MAPPEVQVNSLLHLYDSGAVKRWHTVNTIKEQDVAAHSWGVAMICQYIYPEGSKNLLLAALTHDCAERLSGDIPYTAKRQFENLKVASEQIEYDFNEENGIDYQLESGESEILAWADTMELLLWTKRELKLGNQHMNVIFRRALRILEDLGPPNKRAQELLDMSISMMR